jgi:transposase
MERVIERCGGLDVHKKTVAACIRVPGPKGVRAQHVQTFGTTAGGLLVAGLAGGPWSDARGHGEHRGVLEES